MCRMGHHTLSPISGVTIGGKTESGNQSVPGVPPEDVLQTESEGVEPSVSLPTSAFKADTLNHSDNFPSIAPGYAPLL